MTRSSWEQLPPSVHAAVTATTGPIAAVTPVTSGSIGDLTVVLDGAAGRIFCKAAVLDTDRTGLLRNELRLNAHLPADLAPRLRWHHELDGWLIAGFDHVPGVAADLRPGSPDLPVIAATLTRMTDALTPCPPVNIQPATARWGRLLDPAFVDGDTMLHTDMTHHNFLVAPGSARAVVVDWSMPVRGAAWLDTARMVVRLIRAGHTPAQAEQWAEHQPSWAAAGPAALDAFATLSRRLRDKAAPPQPHLVEMAIASTAWLAHGQRRGVSDAPLNGKGPRLRKETGTR